MEERNTLQKEIILRTLCKMREHPTAAMVYEAVHQNHPTISRSTVYRVLAKMAGEGKILRLEMAACDSRYDGQTAPHHHARCRRCGALSSNRVAADDNPMKLMSIAMKPVALPPFPLEKIEEMTELMAGDGRLM